MSRRNYTYDLFRLVEKFLLINFFIMIVTKLLMYISNDGDIYLMDVIITIE